MSSLSQTAALNAIYLWKGFVKSGEPTSEERSMFGGDIGLTNHVSDFGVVIARFYAAISAEHEEHPDVFEYQVTTAMGAWLRSNPQGTLEQFCATAKAETEKFFTEPCPFLDDVIARILDKTAPAEADLLALATTALVDLSNGWPHDEVASVNGKGLSSLITELVTFQKQQGYDDDGAWSHIDTHTPQG